MSFDINPAEAELQTEIHVRSYGISSQIKPRIQWLINWFQLWNIGRLMQNVCTMIWISFFMFMPMICWTIWFSILAWFIFQLPQLYNSYRMFSRTGSESARQNFDHQMFRFVTIFLFFLIYQIHWIRDRKAEEKGSHPKSWVRRLSMWHYLRRYFPINLILTEEIRLKQIPEESDESIEIVCNPALFPADQNYLIGFHPHGIFGVGAFVNFATEATGFSQKFPGLTPWLATLEINFKVPFHRDIMQSFNIVSATYNGISYLLDPNRCGKRGNMVVIVLGGAPEALDSRPGKYVFHTNRRYGFFKLALMTGTALVPCISFGEPNMYHQVQNPPGCRLRRWQDRFTEMATFSPPIFYAYLLAPYRTPVNTVVSAPIPVSKVENPSREQVTRLKDLYLEKLNELFKRYKPLYDPDADDLKFY